MSEQTDNLTSLLTPFGLTAEEAGIYLVLLENGAMTALAISRKLQLGRTKVYRLLDRMMGIGIVANQFNEIGFKFVAEPPEKLGLLINLQKAKIEGLEKSLPEVSQALLNRMGSPTSGTKVKYYQGKKGLTQVNFNMTRTRGELLSLELASANAFMDLIDAEEMRRELVSNKIKVRTISNARKFEAFTEVTELVTDFWEIRHISKTSFEIQMEMFLYNEVCCISNYVREDVFAVEIMNQQFADMQRLFFERLWQEATPMVMRGDRGEAVLG